MRNKLFDKLKPFLKSTLILGLVLVLVCGNASSALAARSGGRIGGGSFRAPSRSLPSSGGGYRSPGGGYGYPGGGGFGFPFLLPFFGFGGGGGLISILIFIAIANFLVRSFSNAGVGGGGGYGSASNPKVSVAQVQVGLLANARDLQRELDKLARTADTGSASGRALVLQEATLALLRHPEYWVYGSTVSQQTALDSAEAKFNQLALSERSKFSEETLSNVDSQFRGGERRGELVKQSDEPSEYIVVTIVVGVEGRLDLPSINGSDDLNQALRQIGGIGSDRLLAIEVLWTPQAEGDTLTTDDILANYPNLKLV